MSLKIALLLLTLSLAASDCAKAMTGRRLSTADEDEAAAMSWGAGTVSTYSTIAAKGNVKAVGEAVAEARNKGDALAFAEALVNEASKNPSRLDTIAVGLAEATDLSKADASQHLVQEEPVEIARSIANTGEFVTTTGTSLSQAIESVKPAITSAITSAYSSVSKGGDALAVAEAKVKSIGSAVATAFAFAEIPLSLAGDGYGGGEAGNNAEALAISFAEVLVDLFDKANSDFGKTRALYKTEAIGEAIARASASAYAMGSQTGEGFTPGFQHILAEYVSKALVKVVGEVLATAFGQEVDSHKFVVIEVATDAPGWKDPSEDSNSVARD